MTMAKRIVAIALSAALILALAYVSHRCANFSTWWEAAFAYDNLVSLLLALAALRLVYVPVHDLLALACYEVGFEPRPEWALWSFRGEEPKTIKDRFGRHLGNVLFGVSLAYIWSALAVRCG
jgi:hypothetical protein